MRPPIFTLMLKKAIVPAEKIDRAILFLRNKRVMLDADLAIIFGTTTKRINERVKRNFDRFPSDFLFQLTEKEKTGWSQIATTSNNSGFR